MLNTKNMAQRQKTFIFNSNPIGIEERPFNFMFF